MIRRLIKFALTQRLLVLLAALIVAGFGWMSFQQLPIDAYPDISPTQVQIILKAPGVTPTEVETRITAPLETALLGIPNQTMLRSTSKYGIAAITLDFAEGTDIYWARQQVNEALTGVRGDLPAGVTGGVAPITTPLGEAFMFTLESPTLSLTERRSLLDWVIRPALRTVKGVADVNALGGYSRSFEVVPDPAKLAATGLTTVDLVRAIDENNQNDGAGRLTVGEEAWLVRAEGRIRSLEDLRRLVIAERHGQPIRLAQVAEVRIGAITRLGAVTHSGQGETVEGLVLTLRGANARAVVEGVQQRLAELEPSLPKDLKINVFYNRADLVNTAVHTVSKALTEAVVLVLILLMLFLGNWRAAITVALALPMSALITFILMRQFGMTANLMSLGGLAIAIGMLVDAAVVVVENMVAHLAAATHHPEHLARRSRTQILLRGVQEVAAPVVAGIVIIMLVFLPLLSLQGLEGKLFAPVALTIVFALGASLLLSLTLIPVVASLLLGRVTDHEPWLVRHIHRLYEPLLTAALRRPLPVAGIAIALLIAAAGLYTQIGKTFMPRLNEGTIVMQVENLPATTLSATVALNTDLQRALMSQVPQIAQIVARSGSDELGLDPMGLNDTDTFIILKPETQWQGQSLADIQEAIRRVLSTVPGFNAGFTQPIEMRVSEMLTGARGDVAIKVFGPALDELNQLTAQIKAVVEKRPGAEDVATTDNEGVLFINLAIAQAAAARNGLSVAALEAILRAQIDGQNAGIVQEGNARTPILVRADALTDNPQGLRDLPIALPNGTVQPLSSLATLSRTTGPVFVTREMGSRFAVVRANVSGRALTDFVAEAKQAVATQVPLPTGYRLEWGGEFENQQRAANRLALVVPIALGLIFVLLFSTFGSIRQALLVFVNIPFALVGGVFALYFTGEYLSVPASVGFIALLGIAVLNGLVLVSYFNQLAATGLDGFEVVRQGALRRLRPVLMTASIAAFGLVPLLFATGPGSEIQKPLAIVVIGGLVSSTLLTLILLPILYRRFGQPRPPSSV